MKVGDLVLVARSVDLKWLLGIIIYHKPRPHDHLLECYEVLTEEGKIQPVTSAALREINNEI